jgi:CRISPR-associated protein Cmr4
VFGSAVKGALRTKAEDTLEADTLLAVFGPNTTNASAHAGAIAVGDARLLLLPVRSLTSTFKWVTCNEALTRLKRDAELLNLDVSALRFDSRAVQDTNAACNADMPQGAVPGDLFLEEYRFTATPLDLSNVITGLVTLMQRDDAEQELKKRLVIVSDDMFSFLVQQAIPVTAHIAIENETKTVKDGALWYEETLPPETLLYVPLMAQKSRKEGKEMSAVEMRKTIVETLFTQGDKKNYWLQIGGNETVGMGWCGVKNVNAKG